MLREGVARLEEGEGEKRESMGRGRLSLHCRMEGWQARELGCITKDRKRYCREGGKREGYREGSREEKRGRKE